MSSASLTAAAAFCALAWACGDLRREHAKLLFRRRFLRLGGGQRRRGLALVGDRQVVGLMRRPAIRGQCSGARGVGGCPGLLGLGLGDRRLGRLDGGLLLRDLALRGQDRGGGLRGRGAGLGQAGLPVSRVQPDQRLAGADALVVGHVDRDDIALDARAEHRDIALDIGVVGALDPAALGEPPGSCDGNGDRRDAAKDRAEQADSPAAEGGAGETLVCSSAGANSGSATMAFI